MTTEEFKKVLKSNTFKSTNRLGQIHKLQFTEVHLFKDEKHLCDYNITKRDNDFLMAFDNFQIPVSSDDFINVLLKADNVSEQININPLTFKGEYNIIIESESARLNDTLKVD